MHKPALLHALVAMRPELDHRVIHLSMFHQQLAALMMMMKIYQLHLSLANERNQEREERAHFNLLMLFLRMKTPLEVYQGLWSTTC